MHQQLLVAQLFSLLHLVISDTIGSFHQLAIPVQQTFISVLPPKVPLMSVLFFPPDIKYNFIIHPPPVHVQTSSRMSRNSGQGTTWLSAFAGEFPYVFRLYRQGRVVCHPVARFHHCLGPPFKPVLASLHATLGPNGKHSD